MKGWIDGDQEGDWGTGGIDSLEPRMILRSVFVELPSEDRAVRRAGMVAGWEGINLGAEADEDRRWRQVGNASTHSGGREGVGDSSSCEARAREWMRRVSQRTQAPVK